MARYQEAAKKRGVDYREAFKFLLVIMIEDLGPVNRA